VDRSIPDQQHTRDTAAESVLFMCTDEVSCKSQNPGAFSRLSSQVPLVGCAGRGGGFSQYELEKSKNSTMLSALLSRAVNPATLKPSFDESQNGREITPRCGTRNAGFTPRRTTTMGIQSQRGRTCPADRRLASMGAIPSGLTMFAGTT